MKFSFRQGILVALSLLLIGCSPEKSPRSRSRFTPTSDDPKVFAPVKFIQPIDPNFHDNFGSLQEADSLLKDDDIVLGVSVGDVSRAYPLNMIQGPNRELINDTLAGTPIAIAWCSMCFSASVFEREIAGLVLDLGVSGMIWNNNLLMYDKQTNSLWPQVTGTAMSGQLKESRLKRIPCTLVTWKVWKSMNPTSTVALFDQPATDTFVSANVIDERDLFTVGIFTEKGSRAWPLPYLTQQELIEDKWNGLELLLLRIDETIAYKCFSRSVNGKPLNFKLSNGLLQDIQSNSTWNLSNGIAVSGSMKGTQLQEIPLTTCYLKHWKQFFPNCDFWKPKTDRL